MAHRPGQVLDGDREVVDVDLEADADDRVAELERDTGTPDTARGRRLAGLTQELEVDQLRDEARDGPSRQSGLRRYLRARPRSRQRDAAEDDSQVRPPDRRLVGGGCRPAVERHRRALVKGEEGGVTRRLYGRRTN